MTDPTLFRQTVLQFMGPLRDLFEDEGVTEVMVNGPQEVYIEKEGRMIRTDRRFSGPESLLAAIHNVSQFVGRPIDPHTPYLDARLPDGSRFHAMLPPVARRGPYVSIRRFSRKLLGIREMVAAGAIPAALVPFLEGCVRIRRNIVVAGGTGTGKTTLLNVISAFVPRQERIIVIEDASELQLQQEHVLPMEARPPDKQGKGAVTIRDLVHCSLRLRPDRIIVGECRGGETLDMLQAMNTGHPGSMTTLHANSCRDALSRLETMALMSGVDAPLFAVRSQVASAMDLIAQIARFPDGTRRLTEIVEVLGLSPEGNYLVQDLFRFRPEGRDPDTGRVKGELRGTGVRPSFWDDLVLAGVALPDGLFLATPNGLKGSDG